MYKKYAYIKFILESPLSIGCGVAEETDKDVLRDSKGNPYIPASSIAGVYRSFFNEKEKISLFGDIRRDGVKEDENKDYTTKESKLIIYDAVLADENYSSSIRNGVGLDEYKTAMDGAKFDFEVINQGASFWTAIEYTSEDDNSYPINRILSLWKDGKIVFGGKSARGLGRTRLTEGKVVTFDLSIPDSADRWLNFDIYSPEDSMVAWTEYIPTYDSSILIDITLKQVSPLTVRVYTTEVSSGKTAPDYCQLTTKIMQGNEEKTVAVIPGTSWAGVFRHNMVRYLKQTDNLGIIDNLFGMVNMGKKGNNDNPHKKSKISFSETYFDNGHEIVMSRNAIDRLSGGAADSALYTEKMYSGGSEGHLTISIPEKNAGDGFDTYVDVLAASLADLHEGFIAVGGETSIGHGLFNVTGLVVKKSGMESAMESDSITGESIYTFVKETIKGVS